MMGEKNAILFGLGRLARNNWLSRIVKAPLLLFVVLFFFFLLLCTARPRKNERTEWRTTGGQERHRMTAIVSIKAPQAGV